MPDYLRAKDVRAVYAEVRARWPPYRSCSGAATASAPTPGWSPAAGPARASRCWPTTRTSAPASPASGTRPGCTAARSAPVPVRRLRGSPSRACPAWSSGTTSGSRGASPTWARTSATSTWRRSRDQLPARRPLRPAARAARDDPGGRRQGRADHGPQTVHGPILSDVVPNVARAGDTAPVEGKPHGGGYDVSLAWTGLRPGRTADAIFALDTARLPAVPGGGARLRRAGAEPRLRRRRRAHRLPGARADPRPGLDPRRPTLLPATCAITCPMTSCARRPSYDLDKDPLTVQNIEAYYQQRPWYGDAAPDRLFACPVHGRIRQMIRPLRCRRWATAMSW